MGVRRRVDVHIEALRLVGVPRGAAAAVVEGIRSEMERLIAERGVPPRWEQPQHFDRLRGSITGDRQGPALGRAAATSLYEGMGR